MSDGIQESDKMHAWSDFAGKYRERACVSAMIVVARHLCDGAARRPRSLLIRYKTSGSARNC